MPPSLGARRPQRCQDLADLRAAGVAPQRGRRDPEAPAETGGEVAVAREAQRDADGGEIASRLEHLVERRRQPYTQLVAVQRHARELPGSARGGAGRAVPPAAPAPRGSTARRVARRARAWSPRRCLCHATGAAVAAGAAWASAVSTREDRARSLRLRARSRRAVAAGTTAGGAA